MIYFCWWSNMDFYGVGGMDNDRRLLISKTSYRITTTLRKMIDS